jgi:RNA polymerase sigma factor (sigma-70 family)
MTTVITTEIDANGVETNVTTIIADQEADKANADDADAAVNPKEKRDELFEQYIPLANKIACKKHKNMPKCVQLDELKSAAYFGLLDAATKYNPAKHDQFPVYARIRILGEINDYLRRCTWGGRNHPFYGWSLDVPVYGCNSRRPRSLEDCLADSPEAATNEAEEFFLDLTKSLPQNVRNILRYYYLDNLTMKEISLIEGLCESRVSQLMSHYKQVLQKIWSGKEVELWESARSTNTNEKFRLNNAPLGAINEAAGKAA